MRIVKFPFYVSFMTMKVAVFKVMNLKLCHPVATKLREQRDGLRRTNATLIHGTIQPTSQKMRSSHIVYDYITLEYFRYHLLCLSAPNAAAWTDHFIPSKMRYLPCLPSLLLSSLVAYVHYSKVIYLLVKTAVIFLPIRFYFPLHSGLYISILSSNLPPESWSNTLWQSESLNSLRPEMQLNKNFVTIHSHNTLGSCINEKRKSVNTNF